MGDSYLKLARAVLEARGKPLTAQQILADAERHGLMPEHLAGETMAKTLQARLAEDIFRRRRASQFYRTGLGTYYLRARANDPTLPSHAILEREFERRRRPLPVANILFVANQYGDRNPLLLTGAPATEFADAPSWYLPFEAFREDRLAVATFTLVLKDGLYLSHTVGQHSHFPSQVGLRTIGFRRYVDEFDRDLFANDNLGLELSSRREALRILKPVTENAHPSHDGIRFLGHKCTVVDVPSHELLIVTLVEVIAEDVHIIRRLDIRTPRWTRIDELGSPPMDEATVLISKASHEILG